MRGIETNNLENIRKNIDEYSSTVELDVKAIDDQLLLLLESYDSNDLSFLTDKLKKEISELSMVKKNNADYSFVLTEVIKSYHSQDEKIVEELSKVTPQ